MLDIKKLDFNCEKTWDLICSGNTIGIFQLDSPFGQKYSKLVKPRSIEELSDLSALLRPGPMEAKMEDGKSLTDHYIMRKHGEEEVEYLHPDLKPILENTYGILTYQEQSMKIAVDIAGMSLADTDYYIRKCIAEGSVMMTKYGPRYIEDLVGKPDFQTLTPEGWRRVKEVFYSGKKEVYRIKTKTGDYIELSGDHEVDTNYGWVKVEDLEVNKHYLKSPKEYVYQGVKKINKNLSYLASIFIAEGCYTEKCPPKITNSDTDVIKRIIQIIEEEFDGKYKLYTNKKKISDLYFKGSSREWIEKNFDKLKSRNKIIKNMFCCSTLYNTRTFVSGFFDAEGSTSKDTIEISSTSLDIVTKIKYMMKRDGIESHISQKNSTYKGEPYVSYRLYICSRISISIFYNLYTEFVSSRKRKSIKSLLDSKNERCNDNFRIPSNLYESSVRGLNLNKILGVASGTDYKGDKTYARAQNVNNRIGCEFLQSIIDANYKFSKISSIEKIGTKNVYDFTMQDSDSPYAYVNNILVHNCLGKKDPELLAKSEELFIAGAIKNGYEKEVAQQIFDWIKKGVRYLFNASHSVSYSMSTYRQAWVKTHYPKAFFVSSLNWCKDLDEIAKFVNNAKMNGVEVQRPNIKKMNSDFEIIDGEVYYGIGHIKYVGEDVIEKIKETGIPETWNEFLCRVSKRIGKRQTIALISSGCLDFYAESRARMIFEHRQYMTLGEKQMNYVDSISGTLEERLSQMVSLGSGKTTPSYNSRSLNKATKILEMIQNPPTSLMDSVQSIANMEIEFLGCPITCTELDGCSSDMANITCKEFNDGKRMKKMVFAVNIDKMKKIVDKNGNDMAFLEVSDSSGGIPAVVFSECWNNHNNKIFQTNTVLIQGREGRDKAFIADKVWQI